MSTRTALRWPMLLLAACLVAAGCNVIPITVPDPNAKGDAGYSAVADGATGHRDSSLADFPYVPLDASGGWLDAAAPPAPDGALDGGVVPLTDGMGEGPVGDGLVGEGGPADGLVPSEGGTSDGSLPPLDGGPVPDDAATDL
ncbi:MAG: hypothetical protein JRI55_02550 [Deltaproteobacteria bacterium]|nr:hypothetical protein [Deltaproteobacteria bacterium]